MDLKTLCELQGPSGREEQVRSAVMAACAKLPGVTATYDKVGNVVATKKGTDPKAPTVMLCAHMDEVALMVVGATEEGLLQFRALGGIDSRVLVSKRVHVGKDKLNGVIGAMAIHQQTTEDRQRVLPIDRLYVDIGAKDKDEALKNAPLGTCITFATKFERFGQNMALAKALDDRVGVYNLLRVLEGSYPCTVQCVFTNQEEVGCRGATGAAHRLQPDIALILEGTTANDAGDTPETAKVCRCGQGVAVSFMDNASIARPAFFRHMLALAAEKKIPAQVKMSVSGGNESGVTQRAGAGVKTLVLSVPCRYIHSPSTVCSLKDVDAQRDLACAFLSQTDFTQI